MPRVSTPPAPPVAQVRWAAFQDGIGHAFPPDTQGRPDATRAQCGHLWKGDQWSRPVVERCPRCLQAVGQVI